jgi:hypothetical protein
MTFSIPQGLDEFVRSKAASSGLESPAAALTAWQRQEVCCSLDLKAMLSLRFLTNVGLFHLATIAELGPLGVFAP